MSAHEDGGPAFPAQEQGPHRDTYYPTQGMTLRDWFAGQALAGMMASEAWCRDRPDDVARAAYEQADAMLEARKGGDS